jgi:hypothetical protein
VHLDRFELGQRVVDALRLDNAAEVTARYAAIARRCVTAYERRRHERRKARRAGGPGA